MQNNQGYVKIIKAPKQSTSGVSIKRNVKVSHRTNTGDKRKTEWL